MLKSQCYQNWNKVSCCLLLLVAGGVLLVLVKILQLPLISCGLFGRFRHSLLLFHICKKIVASKCFYKSYLTSFIYIPYYENMKRFNLIFSLNFKCAPRYSRLFQKFKVHIFYFEMYFVKKWLTLVMNTAFKNKQTWVCKWNNIILKSVH